MMTTWNWFGTEVTSEKIFYIVSTADPSYYLYDYDPKSGKRTWTQDASECLTFENRSEVDELIERYFDDLGSFRICEACE